MISRIVDSIRIRIILPGRRRLDNGQFRRFITAPECIGDIPFGCHRVRFHSESHDISVAATLLRWLTPGHFFSASQSPVGRAGNGSAECVSFGRYGCGSGIDRDGVRGFRGLTVSSIQIIDFGGDSAAADCEQQSDCCKTKG